MDLQKKRSNIALIKAHVEIVISSSNKSNADYNTELVALAYSMAVEPQRLTALTDLLNARADKLSDASQSEASEQLGDIATHFQHALDLLERQGRRFNYATGSIRFVDLDMKPSALIHKDGKVFHANQAAVTELGFTKNEKMPDQYLTRDEYKRFLKDLKKIADSATNKIVSVYNLTVSDTGEQIKMALSKAIDFRGKPIGRLSTFHIKWRPERGRQFQEGFGLTDVDIAITRAIILGISLRELAESRGRSIATLRSQTKKLLSKLGVHSQVELACLYSGFIHYNLKISSKVKLPKPTKENWRKIHSVVLSDNRNLQYEIVGPDEGRPVLFFHGLLGGMIVSKAMRRELTQRKIKLIMVWRPFFANSSPEDGPTKNAPQRFSDDVKELLDNLAIDTCQIIGQIEGAIYAYACMQKMPDRIVGIVNCGGDIPFKSREQFKLMHPLSRATLLVARYAPLLLPMLTRAILTKIDAGYDEEYAFEFYDTSPDDRQMFHDPEMRVLMREAYPIYTAQGYIPYVKTALVEVSNWAHLSEACTGPISLVHGTKDPVIAFDTVRDYIKNKPHMTLIPVKDGGQMVLYRHPKIVFQTLDEQMSS